MDDSNNSPNACVSCNAWWKLPAFLALLLAAVLLGRTGLRDSTVAPLAEGDDQRETTKAAPATGKIVTLSIDSGDGQPKQLEPVAWREGMTVEDLLRALAGDDVQAEVRGTGASAMLISLGGQANEGANGRNWLYKVNGKHADRSFAVYELEPSDQVLWIFTAPQ